MAKRVFNRELLDECLRRDGATLIGEYDTLNRDCNIQFSCKCGNQGCKNFRRLEKTGMFCKACTNNNRDDKIKNNNIEKYGVEFSFQRRDVKEKIKKTNLEKYGVEYAGQIEDGKIKARHTNLEKYGTEYPNQNEEIKERTKIRNIEKYGVISTAQLESVKEKAKQTNLERYGTEWTHQNEDFKEKAKQTNMKKYGVENPFQSELCKNKSKQTCLDKYGVEHCQQNKDVKEKAKQTNLERYGTEWALQSKFVKEKGVQTNLKKYGVEHPSQNQEVMERTQKNAKRYKEFIMPSGTVVKVQGYEPFALRDLLKIYTEDQLKTERKNVPRVQYEVNGKKRYHFPDIFIPHENKLVEVKSTWTYKAKHDNVLLKKKACEEQGYLYEIWCYDGKGNRVEI